ncbi:cation transporter, partial [Georgenia sp. 10Sc9-8]|nr:cation transporter [Georgenia halotolerans]
ATGDGRWDAVGSAAIGLLLVVIAVFLAIEMASMLIGESALPQHHHAIEAALVGDGVDSVIHMRTLHLGPDEVLVA